MSAIERRLTEALTEGAAHVEPATDLFVRVRSSIDDDRRHRRRLLRWGLVAAAVLVALLESYIVLTDIVYYLIFTAYILFTVRFELALDWRDGVGPGQLQYKAARVGGILLVIGVLHGLNIVIMPVLGCLFSLNRRLQPPTSNPHLRAAPDTER